MYLMEKTDEYRALKKGTCGSLFCCLYQAQFDENDWYCSITPRRALKIVLQYSGAEVFHPMQERVVALAFDEIAKLLLTESGWRVVAHQLPTLFERAIFPALRFKEQDRLDWEEDEEDYLQKNLPLTMDYIGADHLTPRQSALSLLGMIAMSKRLAGARKVKDRVQDGTVGDTLIFPALLNVALPESFLVPTSEAASNYFGTLMAYGGLRQFLKMQTPDFVTMIIHTRVMPVFSMESSSPYIVATACWLIGTLATCMPKMLNEEIYSGLMKALLTPDQGNVSWRPVRTTAARTMVILLQEMYMPLSWTPLLDGAVTGARSLDVQGAILCFQLLSAFLEAGGPSIAHHIPSITSGVQQELAKYLVPSEGRWSQVAEEGLSVAASLAQIWDATEPQNPDGSQTWQKWKEGSNMMACSLSQLLERAWLQGGESRRFSPPSMCLNDLSLVLAVVLKYTGSSKKVEALKIEALLQVWAELVAPWKAWEEKQDMAVFDVIDEAISLQSRCPFAQLGSTPRKSPQSTDLRTIVTVQGFVTFLSCCMESGCAAAASRACRRAHALLHICISSQEILENTVVCFTNSAIRRLRQLKRSLNTPLVKSLLLVIATCFVLLPTSVEQVLAQNMVTRSSSNRNGFLRWGEAFAALAETGRTPGLSKRTELKLAVITLVRLVSRLSEAEVQYGSAGSALACSCILSILESVFRMKQLEVKLQEESEECYDSGVDEESWVGRSEQYIRYRREQLSRELQKEVQWSTEDDHELELGLLNLIHEEGAVYSCLKRFASKYLTTESVKQPVSDFLEKLPEYRRLLNEQGL
ncbi:hypothetical protein R1sor_015082 [Riccia sorocarpa]|uniref:Uncharacterized protein n=1 Tax=Riccia sorocarpa TaxID=122646 RepID=A0ABD3HB88_9MARC